MQFFGKDKFKISARSIAMSVQCPVPPESALPARCGGGSELGRRPAITVFVEAGMVHEDINNVTTPIKLIAVYVIEKGKPLTSPAP